MSVSVCTPLTLLFSPYKSPFIFGFLTNLPHWLLQIWCDKATAFLKAHQWCAFVPRVNFLIEQVMPFLTWPLWLLKSLLNFSRPLHMPITLHRIPWSSKAKLNGKPKGSYSVLLKYGSWYFICIYLSYPTKAPQYKLRLTSILFPKPKQCLAHSAPWYHL